MRERIPYAISALILTMVAVPAHAFQSTICGRATILGQTASKGPGFIAILFMLSASVFWLVEESKGQDASAKKMAAYISIAGVCSAILIFMADRQSYVISKYGLVPILLIILLPCILKAILVFLHPRSGRAMPAMTIIYAAMAVILLQTRPVLCDSW